MRNTSKNDGIFNKILKEMAYCWDVYRESVVYLARLSISTSQSVDGRRMKVKDNRREWKCSEKYPLQCYLSHHKTHMNCRGIKLMYPEREAGD
jgi:hypothetical protein